MLAQVRLRSFKIVGISVRTTNQNGKSANDISDLWQKFYSENISSKITNKVSNEVYSVYTDYESNYTGAYTAIIGHKVYSIDKLEPGLVGREFDEGNYIVFTATGKVPDAIVGTWQEIWNKDKELNRKYSADFELYGEKSQYPDNATIEIYVGIK